MKEHFSKGGKKPKTWELLIAASVAGGLGGVAGNPAGNVVCNRGAISNVLNSPTRQTSYWLG